MYSSFGFSGGHVLQICDFWTRLILRYRELLINIYQFHSFHSFWRYLHFMVRAIQRLTRGGSQKCCLRSHSWKFKILSGMKSVEIDRLRTTQTHLERMSWEVGHLFLENLRFSILFPNLKDDQLQNYYLTIHLSLR